MTASSSTPRSQASTRKKRILLAIVLIPLVTAAGLEIGARIIARMRGKPWNAEAVRGDVEVQCHAFSRAAFVPGGLQNTVQEDAGSTVQILQPYVAWEHARTQALMIEGVRHYTSERAVRALDICILGGSVAQSFGEKGSARLVELLQQSDALRGREVLVHNYACAGYKQPQQAMFLSYLLALGHKPDVVLEIDGFNDAALAWANRAAGVHPSYPYLPFWSNVMQGQRADWQWAEKMHEAHADQERALAFGEWFVRSGLWRSAFLGQACLARFERRVSAYAQSYGELQAYIAGRPNLELQGPKFPSDEGIAAGIIIRVWEQCSLAMKGVCAANGIAYLHVLQPTLKDTGSKPLTEKEIAGAGAEPAWIEGIQRLYPLLRASGGRLSQHGVAFLDATGIFKEHPEDLYTDVCHLNQRGNELMAEAIASSLLETLAHKN